MCPAFWNSLNGNRMPDISTNGPEENVHSEASSVVPSISGLKWPLNQLQKRLKT